MGDISDRLVHALSTAKLIAAEDTRVTEKILRHFGIKTPLISVQKFNEKERVSAIMKVLKTGEDVALVSDAGSPNMCDPGAYLIGRIAEKGVRVEPIPGPSAVAALISVSQIPGDQFSFGGFFPRRTKDAAELLAQNPVAPWVFFESGKRILATLEWLNDTYDIEDATIGKELTKMHERIWRNIPDAIEALKSPDNKKAANGEWVIMIKLAAKDEGDEANYEWAKDLLAAGMRKKDIVQFGTSHMGAKRNELYKAVESL